MSTQDDADIQESLGLFEAAFQGSKTELPRVTAKRVLTVPDGSDQDKTVTSLAHALADRFFAPVESRSLARKGDESEQVDALLATVQTGDILVMPVPFGHDLAKVGHRSLSVTVDLLLTRSPVPILVARHPIDAPGKVLRAPLCVLEWRDRLQRDAAAWACALAADGGECTAVAVPSQSALAEVRALLGDGEAAQRLTDDIVARAERRLTASIVAAIQHAATERNFSASFSIDHGPSFAKVVAERAARDHVVVVTFEQPMSRSHHHVRDVILTTEAPVLAIGLP